MKTLRPRLRVLDTRTARPPPKRADPFYLSPAWRRFVEALLVERFGSRDRARCEDPGCGRPRRVGIRVFGDHVVELQDDGAPFDKANVLFRCGSCHTRKTARVRAGRQAAGVGGANSSAAAGAAHRLGAHAEIFGSGAGGNRDSRK